MGPPPSLVLAHRCMQQEASIFLGIFLRSALHARSVRVVRTRCHCSRFRLMAAGVIGSAPGGAACALAQSAFVAGARRKADASQR